MTIAEHGSQGIQSVKPIAVEVAQRHLVDTDACAAATKCVERILILQLVIMQRHDLACDVLGIVDDQFVNRRPEVVVETSNMHLCDNVIGCLSPVCLTQVECARALEGHADKRQLKSESKARVDCRHCCPAHAAGVSTQVPPG